MAPPSVGWALAHQSLTRKCPLRLDRSQFGAGIFSIEVPVSQIALACVELTKIPSKQTQTLANIFSPKLLLLED